MKDINLLQPSKKEQKQSELKKYQRRSTLALVILVTFLIVGYTTMKAIGVYYTQKTEALRIETAKYSAVTETKRSITTKQTEIQNLEQILSTASGTSYVTTDFLWVLSSLLNEHTFFTSISIAENGSLQINGTSATRPEITYFVYNLKKTQLFSKVSINLVNTKTQEGSADTYDFTVNATLKGGADHE